MAVTGSHQFGTGIATGYARGGMIKPPRPPHMPRTPKPPRGRSKPTKLSKAPRQPRPPQASDDQDRSPGIAPPPDQPYAQPDMPYAQPDMPYAPSPSDQASDGSQDNSNSAPDSSAVPDITAPDPSATGYARGGTVKKHRKRRRQRSGYARGGEVLKYVPHIQVPGVDFGGIKAPVTEREQQDWERRQKQDSDDDDEDIRDTPGPDYPIVPEPGPPLRYMASSNNTGYARGGLVKGWQDGGEVEDDTTPDYSQSALPAPGTADQDQPVSDQQDDSWWSAPQRVLQRMHDAIFSPAAAVEAPNRPRAAATTSDEGIPDYSQAALSAPEAPTDEGQEHGQRHTLTYEAPNTPQDQSLLGRFGQWFTSGYNNPEVSGLSTGFLDIFDPNRRIGAAGLPFPGRKSQVESPQQQDLPDNSMYRTLAGADAPSRDYVENNLDNIRQANPGMSLSQAVHKFVADPEVSGQPDLAEQHMQGVRGMQLERLAIGRVEYDNAVKTNNPEMMDVALQRLSEAHDYVPDGKRATYTRDPSGDILASVDGGPPVRFSPQQFGAFIHGPGMQFDHLMANGVENHLDLGSNHGKPAGEVAQGGQQAAQTTGYGAQRPIDMRQMTPASRAAIQNAQIITGQKFPGYEGPPKPNMAQLDRIQAQIEQAYSAGQPMRARQLEERYTNAQMTPASRAAVQRAAPLDQLQAQIERAYSAGQPMRARQLEERYNNAISARAQSAQPAPSAPPAPTGYAAGQAQAVSQPPLGPPSAADYDEGKRLGLTDREAQLRAEIMQTRAGGRSGPVNWNEIAPPRAYQGVPTGASQPPRLTGPAAQQYAIFGGGATTGDPSRISSQYFNSDEKDRVWSTIPGAVDASGRPVGPPLPGTQPAQALEQALAGRQGPTPAMQAPQQWQPVYGRGTSGVPPPVGDRSLEATAARQFPGTSQAGQRLQFVQKGQATQAAGAEKERLAQTASAQKAQARADKFAQDKAMVQYKEDLKTSNAATLDKMSIGDLAKYHNAAMVRLQKLRDSQASNEDIQPETMLANAYRQEMVRRGVIPAAPPAPAAPAQTPAASSIPSLGQTAGRLVFGPAYGRQPVQAQAAPVGAPAVGSVVIAPDGRRIKIGP